MVKTVTRPLTTTHSHAVRPAWGQRVSSALTTRVAGRVARTAATGPSRATAVSRHSAATLLAASGASSSVPHASATARWLRWYCPQSTATVAWRRGPKAPPGTTAGSVARVAAPQAGHVTRCSRCSVTTARMRGSSVTWCATYPSLGTLAGTDAVQRAQVWGRCSTRWSTRSGESSTRWCATWPGWPPRPRPLGAAGGLRGA